MELKEWVNAIYRNEIIFKGNDQRFHIPGFAKMDFRGPESDHPEWYSEWKKVHGMDL